MALGLLLACDAPPNPEDQALRAKAIVAVQGRFDAGQAVMESAKVQDYRLIRIHDRVGKEGKGPLRATCWFDRQGRLVTVVYPD